MHADRYAVRAGASVTHKSKDLTTVMVERFGDAAGYVGGAWASLPRSNVQSQSRLGGARRQVRSPTA